MIIHYNNKTGDIYSITSGRVHSEKEKAITITISDVPQEDMSKHVVSFNIKRKMYFGPLQEFAEEHEKGNIDMTDYRLILSGGTIEGISKKE